MAWYDPYDNPFVGSTLTESMGSSFNLSLPAGHQSGDLGYVFAYREANSASSLSATGWTSRSGTTTANTHFTSLSRVFNGTETSPFTITMGDSGVRKIIVCLILRLEATPSPQSIDNGTSAEAGTSPDVRTVAGGGTNSVPDQVILYGWATRWEPASDPTEMFTPDADVTELAEMVFDDAGVGGGGGRVAIYARIEGDATFDGETFTSTWNTGTGVMATHAGRWQTRQPPTGGVQDHWGWTEGSIGDSWETR